MRTWAQQALWHTRGLDRHFPPRLVAPIQAVVWKFSSRSLSALAIRYDTDKGPHGHDYMPIYQEILAPRRREPITLLEIGVGGGGSLGMWRHYLPAAVIIGVDIDLAKARKWPGTYLYEGDGTESGLLRRIVREHGAPDVVIDDGSHVGRDIRTSFEALFPMLNRGGWYVIEDLQTAYLPCFGGGPPGTEGTSIDLIRRLLDRTQAGSGQPDLAELRLYNEICFLRRA